MTKRIRWIGTGSPGTINGLKIDLDYTIAAGSDWATRSQAANVVAAYDFSAPPADGGTAFFGSLNTVASGRPKVSVDTSYTNGHGSSVDYSAVRMLDPTVFPPGSSGSMRWDVPTNSGERSDWWRLSIDNYADQFGNGAPNGGEYWCQWRERMNPTYATFQFQQHDIGSNTWNGTYTNFKHLLICRGMQTPWGSESTPVDAGSGPAHASTYYGYQAGAPNGGGEGNDFVQALTNHQTGDYIAELVLRAFDSGLSSSQSSNFKYPGMYHTKVGFPHLSTNGSNSTITETNGGDNASGTTKMCQYLPSSGGSGDVYTDKTTCFIYPSALPTDPPTSRWFSMMIHVVLGPWSASTTSSIAGGNYQGYSNSTVELYGQITPGTAWRLLNKKINMCVCTTGVTAGNTVNYPFGQQGVDRIGMFGWITFMTQKWSGQSHPLAQRWISQVIISKGNVMPAAPQT